MIMLERPATDDPPRLRPWSWSARSKPSATRVATIAPRMAGTEQLVRRRADATFKQRIDEALVLALVDVAEVLLRRLGVLEQLGDLLRQAVDPELRVEDRVEVRHGGGRPVEGVHGGEVGDRHDRAPRGREPARLALPLGAHRRWQAVEVAAGALGADEDEPGPLRSLAATREAHGRRLEQVEALGLQLHARQQALAGLGARELGHQRSADERVLLHRTGGEPHRHLRAVAGLQRDRPAGRNRDLRARGLASDVTFVLIGPRLADAGAAVSPTATSSTTRVLPNMKAPVRRVWWRKRLVGQLTWT